MLYIRTFHTQLNEVLSHQGSIENLNLRSVCVERNSLSINSEVIEDQCRNGHFWISSRVSGETIFHSSHGQGIQSCSLLIIPLKVKNRLSVIQLQRLLGSLEGQVNDTVVWGESEVDKMLACLVIDSAIPIE